MRGQCREEHPWGQVQAQSVAWFLAFTEPLLFAHNARAAVVTYSSQFFRVGYIRVQCQILGSTSEAKCARERKGFPSSFSEAVSPDMGFVHEYTWETKPSSHSLALCAPSLKLLRLLMKPGTSWLHPRAQGEKGFLATQSNADQALPRNSRRSEIL